MKLFFERAKVNDKLGFYVLITAFIVGLCGNWIYRTLNLDPTYALPIIASIPAWKIVRQEHVHTVFEIVAYWIFVTFVYTLVLCFPAGAGLLIISNLT